MAPSRLHRPPCARDRLKTSSSRPPSRCGRAADTFWTRVRHAPPLRLEASRPGGLRCCVGPRVLAPPPLPSRRRGTRWGAPPRRRRPARPRWLLILLVVVVGTSLAVGSAWLLIDGDASTLSNALQDWQPTMQSNADSAPGSPPVRIESTPSGAEVRVDGIRRGRTPLVVPSLLVRMPWRCDTRTQSTRCNRWR